MATYTTNYALTKPTMAETADIRTINGNMDTVDEIMHGAQVSIAPAYDPQSTWDTGDKAMYDFELYECDEDSVTGAWDATKWHRAYASETGGGGGGGAVDYSTNEVDTGVKWIDGRTVFRKVVDLGAMPINTTKSVAHGISSFDFFVKIDAVMYDNTNGYYLPLPYVDNSDTSSFRKCLYIDNTYINVQTYYSDNSDYYGFAILEYVKPSA